MDNLSLKLLRMSFRTIVLTVAALFLPWQAAHALGPVTKLTVTPSTLQLTADQTVALNAVASDAAGESQDVTGNVTFTTTDPRGAFTGNTYLPGKAGSWMITVAYQGGTVTVPVTITAGALAELSIIPDSAPEVVALNKTQTFTTEGFDADNNRLSKFEVAWTLIGDIGSMSTKGVFTPSAIGTGSVVATVGNISTTAQLKVVAARVTTTANTNTTSNTNTAVNENTNAPATVNLNTAQPNTTTDDEAKEICTNRQNWVWGIILLALLGGIAILFAFVPISKGWPAITAIGLAVVLSVIERNYGCAENVWWPWIAILGTGGLTVFAFQQAPKSQS